MTPAAPLAVRSRDVSSRRRPIAGPDLQIAALASVRGRQLLSYAQGLPESRQQLPRRRDRNPPRRAPLREKRQLDSKAGSLLRGKPSRLALQHRTLQTAA